MNIIIKIIEHFFDLCMLLIGGMSLVTSIVFFGGSINYSNIFFFYRGIIFLLVSLSFFWLAGMFKIPFIDDEPTCLWTEEDEKGIREDLTARYVKEKLGKEKP